MCSLSYWCSDFLSASYASISQASGQNYNNRNFVEQALEHQNPRGKKQLFSYIYLEKINQTVKFPEAVTSVRLIQILGLFNLVIKSSMGIQLLKTIFKHKQTGNDLVWHQNVHDYSHGNRTWWLQVQILKSIMQQYKRCCRSIKSSNWSHWMLS